MPPPAGSGTSWDATSGAQVWDSEISSIDTALLLAGVLTARAYFSEDRELVTLATQIYERVDFRWMLHGNPDLLSHGWRDGQFLKYRWDTYCELGILYLLAIGSRTHPIPPSSWYAWKRPRLTYDDYTFVSGGRYLRISTLRPGLIFGGCAMPHRQFSTTSQIRSQPHRRTARSAWIL
jgi:hypothetical protein